MISSRMNYKRKFLLIVIVIIFTCFNIYLKNSTKKRAYSSNDDSTVNDDNHNNNENYVENHHPIRTIKQFNDLNDDLDLVGDDDDDNNNRNNNTQIEQQSTNIDQSTANSSHNIKLIPVGAKKPLIPLIDAKNVTCIDPAYMEFPPDLFSARARARGAILIHILVVCYMFYCLAVVCDHYFLPSLEECAQRLKLSEDVAGATFMAAGSSAPELFTAILGVFIAKGDVGTGTIVGSAVFNILFVIGFCSLYTVSTQLNWWPVARDSSYYTFTVLLLIMCIYDGEVTCFESFILLFFYGVYIMIMKFNIQLREMVLQQWLMRFPSKQQQQQQQPFDELNNIQTNTVQAVHYSSFKENDYDDYGSTHTQYGYQQQQPQQQQYYQQDRSTSNPFVVRKPEVTLFEAANQIIIKYKRLFRPMTRFRAAAHLVIIRTKKARKQIPPLNDMPRSLSMESRKMSKIGPEEDFWRKIPDPNIDGYYICAKWLVVAPLHAALFYTIPDCKAKKNMFLLTFFISIVWTALFSYIMVWMVTMIGFTFGIPDSIMGITFLAAGTSVPDAYASMHVAKMGQADMAVSNSIGSNVFDILVGLALPWFVETAIVEPGTVSSINSGGLVYAVILLLLSLIATIYLFHRHNWTLNPHLGYSLLGTYGAFLIISSAIEFNLFGHVNPPICGE